MLRWIDRVYDRPFTTPIGDITFVATHKYSRRHHFVSKWFVSNHIPRGCLGDYSYRHTADNYDVM